MPVVALALELALSVLSGPPPSGHLPWWARFLLVIPGGVALVWRHDHPWPVFAVALVQAFTIGVVLDGAQPVFVLLAAVYAVARRRDLRAAVVAVALSALPGAVQTVTALVQGPQQDSQQRTLAAGLTGSAVFLACSVAAAAARHQHRSQALHDLRSRTTEADIAMRVQSERLAIARELHDRVACSLAAVTEGIEDARTQARGMREVAAALERTHATATRATGQVASVLAVLEAPAPAPAPEDVEGGLDDLLAGLQRTGWEDTVVDVTHVGGTVRLRREVEHVAVRCVLEGIDNAARHGVEQVQVVVDWRRDPLLIEIVNARELLERPDPPVRGGAGLGSIIQLVTGVGGAVRLESTRAAFRLELSLPV